MIEGSPSLPAGGLTPPNGYASFSLPENPDRPAHRQSVRRRQALRYLPNPRIAAAFRATRKLTLTAGAGIYGQPPDPQDMSPVFGNPTLGRDARTRTSRAGSTTSCARR